MKDNEDMEVDPPPDILPIPQSNSTDALNAAGLPDNPSNRGMVADSGLPKRPRDAHTIHAILHNYGVSAYQERVPLQLMDFAYRYTTSVLQDALHLTSEGHSISGSGGGTGSKNATDGTTVNVSALRLAIHSRTHYQYNPFLPKEFYMELMQEKNRVALPGFQKDCGTKLPPEQYMLTGQHWDLEEELDLMDAEDIRENETGLSSGHDLAEQGDAEEVEGGTMEDVFGHDTVADGQDGKGVT